MTDHEDYPVFLIDPPMLLDGDIRGMEHWRDQCLDELETYPGHEQWTYELKKVQSKIAVEKGKARNGGSDLPQF